MKARRCLHFEPVEIRLFMPLLAVLAVSLSCVGLGMLIFSIVNQAWEKEIPLRLHAAGSSELLPDRSQSPEIVIREDDQVEMDGRLCDTKSNRSLPDLRKKIKAHLSEPGAAKIVVLVEAEARYERMIDVMNAFLACKCDRYHTAILPSFVGPRMPPERGPKELPQSLRRRLELGF